MRRPRKLTSSKAHWSRGAEPLLPNLECEHDDGRREHDGHDVFYVSFRIAPDCVFVVVVVALVKWVWGSKMPFSLNDRGNALEVLKKRHAKGEIGREEFEAMRRDIEKVSSYARKGIFLCRTM